MEIPALFRSLILILFPFPATGGLCFQLWHSTPVVPNFSHYSLWSWQSFMLTSRLFARLAKLGVEVFSSGNESFYNLKICSVQYLIQGCLVNFILSSPVRHSGFCLFVFSEGLWCEGLSACMLVLASNFKIACFSQPDLTLQVSLHPFTHIPTQVAGITLHSATCLSTTIYTHALTHWWHSTNDNLVFQCLAQGQFNCSATGALILSCRVFFFK